MPMVHYVPDTVCFQAGKNVEDVRTVKELHLTKKDFKIEWFSGSGAGGQHRNKHQNCCRITHSETGLSAVGQTSRSRVTNQETAFRNLVGKLLLLYDTPNERIQDDTVVRTYHFERSLATDGAVEKEIGKVMDGDIDKFITHTLQYGRNERKTGRM